MNFARILLLLSLALPACGGSDEAAPADSSADAAAEAPRATLTAEPSTVPVGARDAQVPSSRSRVQFELLDLDLGVLFQEEQHEIRFPFLVEGPDPVTITGVDASCGCSEVALEVEGKPYPINTPIKAGARGAVVGTFDAAQYLNSKNSTIKVLGNALNLPLTLSLKAFIRRHFECSPSTARFGQVLLSSLSDEPQVQRVKITGRTAFELVNWARVPEGIEVGFTKEQTMLEDGRQERWLEIKLTERVPAGQMLSSIIGTTSLGRDLELHVHADVVGPVSYQPENFLKFGAVTEGTLTKRQIKILATDPTITLPTPELEFLGPEHFDWKLVEKLPGREWVVRFELAESAPIGRHGGRLMISYPGDSGIPPREIKVSAMVRKLP